MVGRTLEPARREIDAAGAAAFGESRGEQHMVDAQAEIALEAVDDPIVPPRERLFRLLEKPESVLQSDVQYRLQRCALRHAEEHLALPLLRIEYILVFRRDVEVAHHR